MARRPRLGDTVTYTLPVGPEKGTYEGRVVARHRYTADVRVSGTNDLVGVDYDLITAIKPAH